MDNKKIYYHGGDLEITEFNYNVDKKNRTNNVAGFYFTDRKEKAQSYGVKLTQVYLKTKNPFILGVSKFDVRMGMQFKKELIIENPHMDKYDDWFDEKVQSIFQYNRLPFTGMDGMAEQRVYQAGGFDSIKDGDEIAVFNSKDIKIISSGIVSENSKNLIKQILRENLLLENKIYPKQIITATLNRINDSSEETINKIVICGLYRSFFGDIQQLKTKEQLDTTFQGWYNTTIEKMLKTKDFTDNKNMAIKYLDAYIKNIKSLGNSATPFSFKNIEKTLVDLVNNNKWVDDNSIKQSQTIYTPNSGDILFESDEIIILNSDTKAKCVTYGHGESWCITKPDENYYNTYRLQYGATPYFVLQKNIQGNDHKVVVMNYNGNYAVADRENSSNHGGPSLAGPWSDIEKKYPNLMGLEKYFQYREVSDEETIYSELIGEFYSDDNLMEYILSSIKGLVVNGSQVTPEDFIRDYAMTQGEITTEQQVGLTDSVKNSLIESGYFTRKEMNFDAFTRQQINRVIRINLNNNIPLHYDFIKDSPIDNDFLEYYDEELILTILQKDDDTDILINNMLTSKKFRPLITSWVLQRIINYSSATDYFADFILNDKQLSSMINSLTLDMFIYKTEEPDKYINIFMGNEELLNKLGSEGIYNMVEESSTPDVVIDFFLNNSSRHTMIKTSNLTDMMNKTNNPLSVINRILSSETLTKKIYRVTILTIMRVTNKNMDLLSKILSNQAVLNNLSEGDIEDIKKYFPKEELAESHRLKLRKLILENLRK